ncbi:calcium channel protein [Pseudomonas poae]|uniref:Calcium channel protein n=2 Tax=Pseudomonas poae TaxID=200451 RepID=A0A423ESR5_9PSED|nr:calcium channel protein [Pseudomonas poae]
MQAKSLLENALAYYREAGDIALAEFSRQGRFTTEDNYVYVVDTHGVMLASGGPSAIYIGRNITTLLDNDLRKAFAAALEQPESEVIHSQEYRWMNWRDHKVERKHVFYQRLGDKIFAAGYYLPRSSPQEAQLLLDDAVSAIASDAKGSLARINALDPFFNRDDLYVFVVDIQKKRFIAHGFDRRLIGTDFSTLKSVEGQPIGKQMLGAITGEQTAQVNYLWHNPMTGAKEYKHTLLKSIGTYLVAVGYYSAAKP